MNAYDKQREVETEVYSQALCDEQAIAINSKLESSENALDYLEEAKDNLLSAKTYIQELHKYEMVSDLQTMIDDISNCKAEIEIYTEELEG